MGKSSGWLWAAAEFVLSVIPLIAGYRIVLWVMAKPIAQLPANLSLPEGCPAFRFDHNLYICEPLGTTQSQPALFIAAVVAIAACYTTVAWIYLSGRSERFSFAERIVAVVKGHRHGA